MSSVIIYKNLEKYCSFPSIIKIENNHLLVAFRIAGERSNKAGKENVVTHHDPDSSIALIESYDNGNTWPKESFRIIYKAQDYQGVNDPALTILNNGDLISIGNNCFCNKLDVTAVLNSLYNNVIF